LSRTAGYNSMAAYPLVCWGREWTWLAVWATHIPSNSQIFVSWLEHSFPVCFRWTI